MRNLIITSDDCGLSEGINLATASLHERGLLTTASIMTNFESSYHALDLLGRYPALDAGVHLNLTDGFPLTAIATSSELTQENGEFRGRHALFSNALAARRSFLRLARTELAAQIDFFLNAGLKPRHLTTHIHFHWFPSLRNIVCDLAHKYDIEWVRNNDLLRTVIPFNLFLSMTGHKLDADPLCKIAAPDYIVGLQFWIRHSTPEQLLERLLHLGGTLELVVHPSLEHDPTYPQTVAYQPQKRFEEMRYFKNFLDAVQEKAPGDFRFATMREVHQ